MTSMSISPGAENASAPPGRSVGFAATPSGKGDMPLLMTLPAPSMSGPIWTRTVGFPGGNALSVGTPS